MSKHFSAILKETKQNLKPIVLERNDHKHRPSQIYMKVGGLINIVLHILICVHVVSACL